jgi:hypothetical protein
MQWASNTRSVRSSGKQAELIMVRTDSVAVFSGQQRHRQAVEPSDVDTVMTAGVIRKRSAPCNSDNFRRFVVWSVSS